MDSCLLLLLRTDRERGPSCTAEHFALPHTGLQGPGKAEICFFLIKLDKCETSSSCKGQLFSNWHKERGMALKNGITVVDVYTVKIIR